ncbi:MAG: DUF5615 family PIN-like protein [Acidobacteria bacterium]|nr:DUF5615 family PIN-like protein [Acidobacteriota bacterium]
MRVLLDECVNPRLKEAFSGHEVRTVADQGWKGLKNGELLLRAEREFDVFLTIDRNLEHQQNLRRFRLGVVVAHVPDNRMESYGPIVAELRRAVEAVELGEAVRVVHAKLRR